MAPLAIADMPPRHPLIVQNRTTGRGYNKEFCRSPLIDCNGVDKHHHRLKTEEEDTTLSKAAATTAATTSNTATKRRKAVSFAPMIQCKETHHISDMSVEDVVATWWTPNDYHVIRKMVALTVKLISCGSKFGDDDTDFCERGLEIRTKDGARTRHTNKRKAISVVLEAQEFQIREGFTDPEYIAELYSEYTRNSNKESHEIGLKDEIYVFAGRVHRSTKLVF